MTVIVLRVAVGTTNPCKIKAVEHAIHHIVSFHHNAGTDVNANKDNNTVTSIRINDNLRIRIQVQGYNVSSGVSDQPYSDDETKMGAMNRARNAYYYHIHHNVNHNFNNSVTDKTSDVDDTNENFQQEEEQVEELPHLGIGIEGGLEWVLNGTTIVIGNDSNKGDDLTQPSRESSDSNTYNKQLYGMAWVAIYGLHNTPLMHQIFGNTDKAIFTIPSHPNDPMCTTQVGDDIQEVFGLSKSAMFALPPSLCTLITEQNMELGQADDTYFHRINSKQSSGTIGLLTNTMIDRASYYEHAIQLAIIPWLHPKLYPHGHISSIH